MSSRSEPRGGDTAIIRAAARGGLPNTMERIRNFSIIAHVDHGKSTLADRLIQLCGGLTAREMEDQVLDSMDLERERGITIKAQSVALQLPRARRARLSNQPDRHAGARRLLLRGVAVARGVRWRAARRRRGAGRRSAERRELLHGHRAGSRGAARHQQDRSADGRSRARHRPDRGHHRHRGQRRACCISAKTGLGVDELLERIVERIPAPKGSVDAPLQALIIDSWFDSYAGVVSLVRVMNGVIRKDARIVVHSTQRKYTVEKVGVFTPRSAERQELKAGEVGFLIAAMREINAAPVGDTIVDAGVPNVRGAAGVQEDPAQSVRRLVSARVRGLREVPRGPAEARVERLIAHVRARGQRIARLRHALRFLGSPAHGDHSGAARARARSLADLDGADRRLRGARRTTDEVIKVENPADLPEPSRTREIREPIILASILVPQEYLGAIIQLCIEKRGKQKRMQYSGRQVQIEFELPLAEVVLDFFDRLKSVSRGYASFDYQFLRFEAGAARQARHSHQRREGRCDGVHRASRRHRAQGTQDRRDAEGSHPAAAIRGRDSGRDRLADHRARRP